MKVILVTLLVISAAYCMTFPKQYYLEGTFSLPYANISEPVSMHYDGANNRARLSFYHDLAWWLYRYDTGKVYEMFIWKDHRACLPSEDSSTVMPLIPPDLDSWTDKGDATVNNIPCKHLQFVEKRGEKVNTYDFYAYINGNNEAVPVKYSMIAYDTIFMSHYDEYIMEYGLYIPNFVSEAAFVVPELCINDPIIHHDTVSRADRGMAQIKMMFPRNVVQSNLDFIAAHNAKKYSFTMKPNKFTKMSYDEFKSIYANRKHNTPAVADFEYKFTAKAIPDAIDWRELGAVTMVKDQSVCGSCWAYGTTGAFEGAYYLKYHQQVSFSEQELVDCSWTNEMSDRDLNGCDGGIQELAFEWIRANGGLSYGFAYPYIMQDDYCGNRSTQYKAATLTTYANVTVGDENALKEAVALYGPVTVGIDVLPSMIYYGSGVYYEPNCKSDPASLDHAVLVVGYGTENGQDYWIVKNSWSDMWGDKGYIKMARNRDNNCGIATEASFIPYWAVQHINH